MQVVILCGGLGSRLGEETSVRPKPMVTIGGNPILWHIMKIYSAFKLKNFILPLGYKGDVIKNYFLNYYALNSNLKLDLKTGTTEYLNTPTLDWSIQLIETGMETMTGGRLFRLKDHLRNQGTFMLTYGDGVADINIQHLLEFHYKQGKIATVTAVRPTARFGVMGFNKQNLVTNFREKQQTDEGWINGGFFIFEPKIFDYLDGDDNVLEGSPLERLAKDGQLAGYHHEGFWQCMDTLRDRQYLENLWDRKEAPWKTWT